MSNICAKDCLIYAAIEVFGVNGFEHASASTRQIPKSLLFQTIAVLDS